MRNSRYSLSLILIAVAIGTSSCRGGGGGSGTSGGRFEVRSISASLQTGRVYLNQVIEIQFSAPVDPATVLSGVFIYPSDSAGGRRAAGTFEVDGATVRFHPALPSSPDLTDGGFLSDTKYTICIPQAGASCAVFVQNANGVRSTGGRGLPTTRRESFETVRASDTLFEPEAVARRPEIEMVRVRDAAGVSQVVNPVLDLASGATKAGVLSTVRATPPTTLGVPNFAYRAAGLDRRLETTIDRSRDVTGAGQLAVALGNLSTAMVASSFEDRGAILTIRDRASPPNEGSWVVETNTADRVMIDEASGPTFAAIPFVGDTLDVIVEEGVTRSVNPGDGIQDVSVEVVFDEALDPVSVVPSAFELYSITERGGNSTYARIALASQLSSPPGLRHRILEGRSHVELRPEAGFPSPAPGERITVFVRPAFSQVDNGSTPVRVSAGLRDLNGYSLAYPRRAGAVYDAGGSRVVARVQSLAYESGRDAPEDLELGYGFVVRAATAAPSIIERFDDLSDRASDCRSTASWSLDGRPGLFAGYGYGGSGADGVKVVDNSETLDSSTREPGADGVVSWDFIDLRIDAGATLNLVGPYPIRLNALRDIHVAGLIDASGQAGGMAPSGAAGLIGLVPGGRGGPGGGDGGAANPDPANTQFPLALRGGPGMPRGVSCAANRSFNGTNLALNCGGATGGNRGKIVASRIRGGCTGAGGGHAGPGESSTNECAAPFQTAPTIAWLDPTQAAVTAPSAGTGGGAGGNAPTTTGVSQPMTDVSGGGGGGGGGGFELCAAGSVEITGGAILRADGGNGGIGATSLVPIQVRGGYGGGGAGGSIWLTGTSVLVDQNVRLSAVGGIGYRNLAQFRGNGGAGYVIIRDRAGAPDVRNGANTTPPRVTSRQAFAPSDNGESVATSRWYAAMGVAPNWRFNASDPVSGILGAGSDLAWVDPPLAGQRARISFQAAPSVAGRPDPDPSHWFPANTVADPCAKWETDLSAINGAGAFRFLRFRIEFDIGDRSAGAPPPIRVAVERIRLRY